MNETTETSAKKDAGTWFFDFEVTAPNGERRIACLAFKDHSLNEVEPTALAYLCMSRIGLLVKELRRKYESAGS